MTKKKSYFKPWDPQPKSKEILEANALELMRLLKWFTRCAKIKGPADTDLYIIGPQWMKAAKKLIKDLEAGVSHCAINSVVCLAIAAACLVGYTPSSSAAAAGSPDLDPGAHQTGPAECAKILWVGGYRVAQPGSCPEKPAARGRRRKGYTDKDDQQRRREAFEMFKQERKAQREAEKAKEKEARDARKAKDDRAKACRGLGLPANCDLANPGHTKARATGASSPKGKAKK